MHIVVCIKQTPVVAEARLDPETKTLVREGVTLTLNSFDRRAVVEALRLRGELGGSVTVITMGPPQARDALVECLGIGADRAIHLTDRAFAGADTLATSRTLAMALRKLQPDLVLCGKFSVDAETGQVPPEIAEFLDLPQVTAIRKIRPGDEPNTLWVERETDEGYEHWQVSLPAVLSVTEWIILPRRASPEDMAAAAGKPLEEWHAGDLESDPSVFGSTGSPTTVAGFRTGQLEREGIVVSGEDPEAAAQQAVDYLVREGLFQGQAKQARTSGRRRPAFTGNRDHAVWVVAEIANGRLRPVTHELLGKAQQLATELRTEVAALLLGGPDVVAQVGELGAYGADTVYLADDDRLTHYETERYAAIVGAAIRRFQPFAVLIPSTPDGRDLAPRVAARLQVGLTGDCVGLELDDDGRLVQLKPAFGGNIVVPIYSSTMPQMATVRAGMLDPVEADWSVSPQIVSLSVPSDVEPRARLLQAVADPDMHALDLEEAAVIVSVGMGVGGPENIPVVRELAAVLDAPISSSLRAVGAQWLPYQLQIGLTGKAVAPRFYIAVGVSGAANHLMGVKRAQHIIAINSNPEAPIFKACNFGIVGDWAQVVPALTRALQAAKERASA